MKSNSSGYVTVIGFNLVEPILELIEKLESNCVVEPNEVQSAQHENGFACGIITLSICILESAFNRTKYIRGDKGRIDPKKYFLMLSKDEILSNEIDEIIAIRDAIVHNHLWEASVHWDDRFSLKFSELPKPVEGYGNDRRKRVMNESTRLSHQLGLNLFPLRIWRRDAYIVFKVVYNALAVIGGIDNNYFPNVHQYFMFSGDLLTLDQVIQTLPYCNEAG
jgi:hypothetical protein